MRGVSAEPSPAIGIGRQEGAAARRADAIPSRAYWALALLVLV